MPTPLQSHCAQSAFHSYVLERRHLIFILRYSHFISSRPGLIVPPHIISFLGRSSRRLDRRQGDSFLTSSRGFRIRRGHRTFQFLLFLQFKDQLQTCSDLCFVKFSGFLGHIVVHVLKIVKCFVEFFLGHFLLPLSAWTCDGRDVHIIRED